MRITVILLTASLALSGCGKASSQREKGQADQEKSMSRAQVVELIGALEAEVNNGGFDQFFFNSAGNRTAETIAALKAIGAKRTADIVSRAAAKFPAGLPPSDRTKRQELLEKVSPDADAFDEEDEAFLKYEDNLSELLKKYTGKG